VPLLVPLTRERVIYLALELAELGLKTLLAFAADSDE